ncbi:hypothetical protein BGZ93_010158 [Podila epicladia]|nr:hypothetical protein BGZ93_010158 [Podila epicladia]
MSHEAPTQPSELQRHLRPTVLGFDEVLLLKGEHVRIGKPSSKEPQWFYSVSVFVPFRRSDDPSQANVYYRIQPQAEEPHTCFVSKLLDWFEWTIQHEHRTLQGNDFLFPYHTSDDLTRLKEPFTSSMVLQLINRYASDAGILNPKYARLDTHCLRRSGALYRLVHAKNTWHFDVIRWWGGWSENAPAEEIVRYLLDDTQDRASFGTVMSLRQNRFQGHTGAARRALEDLVMRDRIESAIQSMESIYMSALAKIEQDRHDIRNERNGLQHAITELRNTVDRHIENVAHALASHGSAEACPPVTELAPESGQSQQPQAQPPHQPRQRRAQVPPLQHLEQTIPDITHWKEAIRQWEKGDRTNGLTIALSKWTTDMKKAPQHKRSYEARKKIVEQYKIYGQDGRRMRKEYGDKMNTVGGLLTAIDLRIKLQRKLQKE